MQQNDLGPQQLEHIIYTLKYAEWYAWTGNRVGIIDLMARLYAEVDESPPSVNELPFSVRSVIDSVLSVC